MKKIIMLSIMGMLVLASCKKDKEEEIKNPENTSSESANYNLLATDTTSNDEIVTVYAKNTDHFEVGYNPVFFRVNALNGDPIDNATVTLNPVMDMGTMQHESPKEYPHYNLNSKYYEGVVVFTMSSNMGGSWSLNLNVNAKDVVLPVEVLESPSNTKYVAIEQGTNGEEYIISLVQPNDWEVGMNDLSILVNKKSSMTYFPPVEGLTVTFEPIMTSMGHSSPNNVTPIDSENGYYTGKVNYTMTGDWQLNFDLIDANDTILNTHLDIKF